MNASGFEPTGMDVISRRLSRTTILIVAVFAILIMRLWFLQIIKGEDYRRQSENNRIRVQDISPLRGRIFDRKNQILVDNRPSFDVFIHPDEMRDSDLLVENLKLLLAIEPELIEGRLEESIRTHAFKPVSVKKNITREELALVETHLFNLAGAVIQVRPQRHYLYDGFASHLIGYLGEISEVQIQSGFYPDSKPGDFIGKYGVEMKWQKHLGGVRGGERIEVDAVGRQLRVISRNPPVSGEDIGLTIDRDLQLLAEKALLNKKGAIVAMDPATGEILAMASSPVFEPNAFVEGIDRATWIRLVSSKEHPLQNRAIAGQYPPGSIFKMVLALAALEEGLVDPKEAIVCEGSFPMGSHTFHCWQKYGHGMVNLHRALVESCDVYFYKLGRRLGVDKIAHYARICGLGNPTGFDLGAEKEGLIPTSEWKMKRFGNPWQPGETISVSIGQSYVLVTPIQMARHISAIFNGGYLYQPRVVAWAGKDRRKVSPSASKSAITIGAKEHHLNLIREALTGVVNQAGGTGSRARIKGITVAGKTGTAQVISLMAEKGARDGANRMDLNDHAWFVSIAPVEQPAIAVAIVIENGGHGGSAAAPIAKLLMESYLKEKRQGEVLALQSR